MGRGHKVAVEDKETLCGGWQSIASKTPSSCAEGTRGHSVEGTGVLCSGPRGIVSRALCRSVEGTGVLCGGPVVLYGGRGRHCGDGAEVLCRGYWGILLNTLAYCVMNIVALCREHWGIVSRALGCYAEDTEALCREHSGIVSCRVAFCRRHWGIILRVWCIVRKALGHCFEGTEVLSRALRHCHWGIVSKALAYFAMGTVHWGEPHDGCSYNHRQHGRGEESAAKCFRFVPLV